VRRTLEELPESLDETYERILKEIKKPNRGLAQRVLQCLVVAIRPLRVAELAEVLAVDFDDSEGIPRLNADWRWEDQEQALLIACSSLIAIVEGGYSRVVQFSHFSVKEFLTSSRLSSASGEVSAYRIDLENAHTILAQACLGILLQTHDEIDWNPSNDHPLARYAAEHWTTHAQFGEVSSRLQKGMEYLFNPDKPLFRVWLTLYDIDTGPDEGTFYLSGEFVKSAGHPVYYAALCGFRDLVQHLITKYPQEVNADGGYYGRPLVAALVGEHFKTADLLRHSGADSHVRGGARMWTPLHSAAYYGNLEIVKKLIEYGADISAEDLDGCTPLFIASEGRYLKDRAVIRLLVEHGADINARTMDGSTPLHEAALCGALDVVRLLLEHGADVEAKDDDGKTAIQVVGMADDPVDPGGLDEIKKLLLENRAKR
jgi:Ankyrin repeats (3 copies)